MLDITTLRQKFLDFDTEYQDEVTTDLFLSFMSHPDMSSLLNEEGFAEVVAPWLTEFSWGDTIMRGCLEQFKSVAIVIKTTMSLPPNLLESQEELAQLVASFKTNKVFAWVTFLIKVSVHMGLGDLVEASTQIPAFAITQNDPEA